jgi:threonine/homoserine/homoserine lactone efflux protein
VTGPETGLARRFMPEWPTISLFVVAAGILVFSPGPNTLYILTRSLHQGPWAGVASSLGIQVGTLFHACAAALGISALVLSSALAFGLVKYAGAAYLVYLGIRTILASVKPAPIASLREPLDFRATFYQAVAVAVLNPKTALFFTAFLPQFIDLRRGSVVAQIFFFALIIILLGVVNDLTYALLAGRAGHWLRTSRSFLEAQRYISGVVYIGLGAVAALTGTARR